MEELNAGFLRKLDDAFHIYLTAGARSNEKLKPVHSFISDSLQKILDDEELSFHSLRSDSRGGEKVVVGRYMEKQVDIAVCRAGKPLVAVGFKFVMSNYKQNSNNYFENMLGETANLRCTKIPYFQILVLLETLPYYKNDGKIGRLEKVNEHNLSKYIALSRDNENLYFHTPTKTLLYIVKLPENDNLKDKKEYADFYKNKNLSPVDGFNKNFDNGVVINDFKKFAEKISHYIKSI
jgi:hypothetical protein